MKEYGKKPIVILAEQWFKLGDVPEANIKRWPLTADSKPCKHCGYPMKEHGLCPTPEGEHIVCPEDYIIRGIQGEFYPRKPDIFKETYETSEPKLKEKKMASFGWALAQLKEGKKVRRKNWKKEQFIFLVPGSEFKVNRPPLLGIYPEGTEIKYHAHIDMKTTQGYIIPWLASQADLLEEDWEELE